MNGKCIFGGKKFFAPALFAAALSLALLFGCSSGGDDGSAEIPSQGGTQDGVQNPSTGGNAGGEQTPGQGEGQPGEGENPGGEVVVPPLEYSCEITSVSMPNESISPKRVADVLNGFVFAYTITNASTGDVYQQESYVFYKDLPEEIKNEIRFMEVAENGSVERNSEYEFTEIQKEISFEIWQGGKTQFKKTLKNGNYDYSKVLKIIADLLKGIIGEAEYDAISANAKSGNLTFTAENVKAVYDYFPALEKAAESGKGAKDVENAAVIRQNKEAFVAQAEGEVEIKLGIIYPDWYEVYPEYFNEEDAEKKCTVTYKKNFAFEGEFNLDDLQFEKVDGAQGNFDNATLTNNGTSITVYEINQIRGSSLPILKFDKTENNIVPSSNPYKEIDDGEEAYNLYRDYMWGDLDKIQIKGNMSGTVIDGSK
ncbi:MAG: hypothetical protein K2N58_00390 [Treponemataceae bacterium]|nr:hypothetical protein [Treponemataceae bacterium]